jgi:hypothetical protein
MLGELAARPRALRIEVAGTRIYHQGSADLIIEDEIRDRGGHGTVSRADRACVTAGTDHLDPPRGSRSTSNLTGFADEVHRASRDLSIATLPAGARIG